MTDDAQMKLRLPAALKRQIETAAIESNRSLNGEIVSRLEASFPDYIPDVASARRGPRHETVENRLAALEDQMNDLLEILGMEINGIKGSAPERQSKQLREMYLKTLKKNM